MIVVPAAAWRGGRWYRAAATGLPIGIFFGALAWLDSGMLLSGAVVAVILGVAGGIWMSRRMRHFWPGAQAVEPGDRVAVVRAARQGVAVDQQRLVPAVVEYQQGLHAVVNRTGELKIRWLVWLILVAAAAMALFDFYAGSERDGVASVVYLVLLVFDFFGWPPLRDRLLARADRSATLSSAAFDGQM